MTALVAPRPCCCLSCSVRQCEPADCGRLRHRASLSRPTPRPASLLLFCRPAQEHESALGGRFFCRGTVVPEEYSGVGGKRAALAARGQGKGGGLEGGKGNIDVVQRAGEGKQQGVRRGRGQRKEVFVGSTTVLSDGLLAFESAGESAGERTIERVRC